MPSFIDRTGFTYGDLKVIRCISRASRITKKKTMWQCLCVCGALSNYSASNLVTGNSTCCLGCRPEKQLKHGHAVRTDYSATYSSWQSLKGRCLNPGNDSYENYGGRGIGVCERWRDSFENFLEDMGVRPVDKTIDRIDVNGDYTVLNCRWASKSQQMSNRRQSEDCGLYFRKDTKKWTSYITRKGIKTRFGSFETKAKAKQKREEFEKLILIEEMLDD